MTFDWNNARYLNVEATASRMACAADLPAALRSASLGELAFIEKQAALWASLDNRTGMVAVGEALALLVDSETARREWEHAAMLARFDAMVCDPTVWWSDV